MLYNMTPNSSQSNYKNHAYSVLDNISHHEYEMFPLTTGISRITNDTEIEMTHTVAFPTENHRGKSTQTGLLTRLLTGAAIVTATGILATGCYYGYIGINRAGSSVHPEQRLLLLSSDAINEYPQDRSTSLPMNIQGRNKTVQSRPETFRTPYSYYENIYSPAAIRNKTLLATTVTNPITVTVPTEYSTTVTLETSNADISPVTYDHERDIYYNDLPNDIYYPLDEKIHLALADFCRSRIEHSVIQAATAEPIMKCKLLGFIYDMIEDLDYHDNALREMNSEKETLTSEELFEKIITRRKLTTLLLAGEYIIDSKETADFYSNAMADNNHYTSKQIAIRKAHIKDYYNAQNERC